MRSYDNGELAAAKVVAVHEQPRQAANRRNPRALPHGHPCRQDQSNLLKQLNLDCRLLIWKRPSGAAYKAGALATTL